MNNHLTLFKRFNKIKKPGLTLIEVIISVALFAILSIPVAGFVNSSIKMNHKAQIKQQSTVLAQKIFEEIDIKGIFNRTNDVLLDSNINIDNNTALPACTSDYCIINLPIENTILNIYFTKITNFVDDTMVGSPVSSSYKDLYTVQIEIYDNQKTNLLFTGKRVVPLEFN